MTTITRHPQYQYLVGLTEDELITLLGALHDTKCLLEKDIADPATSDQNYSDMTDEVIRILALETKLKEIMQRIKY